MTATDFKKKQFKEYTYVVLFCLTITVRLKICFYDSGDKNIKILLCVPSRQLISSPKFFDKAFTAIIFNVVRMVTKVCMKNKN